MPSHVVGVLVAARLFGCARSVDLLHPSLPRRVSLLPSGAVRIHVTTSAVEILVAVRLSACARSVGLVVVPVRLFPLYVAR